VLFRPRQASELSYSGKCQPSVAFRKKIYRTIDELQNVLDVWVREYNETRLHQGRWCYGKTPIQTFLDALPIAREKLLPVA
jgi:hypothetical protein